MRPHIPWYLRWSMTIPFVLAALGLAWWAYGSGLEVAGFYRGQTQDELKQLSEQVAKISEENVLLHDRLAQFEQQIRIEQASNQETLRQLKNLSEEKVQLQEDLAFFQNLTTTRGKEGEVGIHRLRLERDTMPGEYRVRMLLVQTGQRAKEFIGSYQLVAIVHEKGQVSTRVFPQNESEHSQFRLNFKYYHRLEQNIRLPPEVRLENVQVRIFERDELEPKVRQSVNLL